MNDKVKVISSTPGIVSIKVESLRLKRKWPRKGAVVSMDKEILREALYEPGVEYLFKTGMLYIEDLQDKIDLELEPETATEPENIIVLSEDQMKRLLTFAPKEELSQKIDLLSKEQRQNLADLAIKLQITDLKTCSILKEKTGRDVLSIVYREVQ